MADGKQTIEPPKTGMFSVRVGVYVAQLIVSGLLTYFIRKSLVSQEMAGRLRNSPEYQVAISLLAEGIAMLFVVVQGYVATIFFKVSGQIATKKIETIGDYNKQLVIAASPNPPSTNIGATENKS